MNALIRIPLPAPFICYLACKQDSHFNGPRRHVFLTLKLTRLSELFVSAVLQIGTIHRKGGKTGLLPAHEYVAKVFAGVF